MRIHFQMIILPFIPILALIVQTSVTLQEILEYRSAVADIETQVSSWVGRWVGKWVGALSDWMRRWKVANKANAPRKLCLWGVIKIYYSDSIKRQVDERGRLPPRWSMFTWPSRETLGPSVCSGKCVQVPVKGSGARARGQALNWVLLPTSPSRPLHLSIMQMLSPRKKIWKREWKILNVPIWAKRGLGRRTKWIDKDAMRNMQRQSPVKDGRWKVVKVGGWSLNRGTYLECKAHYKQIKGKERSHRWENFPMIT